MAIRMTLITAMMITDSTLTPDVIKLPGITTMEEKVFRIKGQIMAATRKIATTPTRKGLTSNQEGIQTRDRGFLTYHSSTLYLVMAMSNTDFEIINRSIQT